MGHEAGLDARLGMILHMSERLQYLRVYIQCVRFHQQSECTLHVAAVRRDAALTRTIQRLRGMRSDQETTTTRTQAMFYFKMSCLPTSQSSARPRRVRGTCRAPYYQSDLPPSEDIVGVKSHFFSHFLLTASSWPLVFPVFLSSSDLPCLGISPSPHIALGVSFDGSATASTFEWGSREFSMFVNS